MEKKRHIEKNRGLPLQEEPVHKKLYFFGKTQDMSTSEEQAVGEEGDTGK